MKTSYMVGVAFLYVVPVSATDSSTHLKKKAQEQLGESLKIVTSNTKKITLETALAKLESSPSASPVDSADYRRAILPHLHNELYKMPEVLRMEIAMYSQSSSLALSRDEKNTLIKHLELLDRRVREIQNDFDTFTTCMETPVPTYFTMSLTEQEKEEFEKLRLFYQENVEPLVQKLSNIGALLIKKTSRPLTRADSV